MIRALKRVQGWWGGVDPAWRAALPAWAAARLGLGLWAAWIWLQGLMPEAAGGFYFSVAPVLAGWQGALLGMWQRWDGIYYQMIAEIGYDGAMLSAFFPAYPLLGRALAQVSGLPVLAALLVLSALAVLLSLVLLYRIAADLFPNRPGGLAVWSALLFPTAFFLFGVYPQALALLWMLLAYDQARRGRWLAAALAGLLAGLTHGTVLPLTAMLAVMAAQEIWEPTFPAQQVNRSFWRRFVAKNSDKWLPRPSRAGVGGWVKNRDSLLSAAGMLAAAGAPLLGMGLFLAWREAMGFPGLNVLLDQHWERIPSLPWETLWALVVYLPDGIGRNWVIGLNTVILGLAVFSIAWGWRRLPLALNVYQVTLLLYLLSNRVTSDPLLSLNRYVLGMFPLYLALAGLQQGKRARAGLFALGLLASLGISAMFFMWKWVG